MLLKKLTEYSERQTLPPTGYDNTPIRWIIDLNSKFSPPSFVSTTGTSKKNDRGLIRLAPFRERTSTAIRSKLLADDGEYTFGKAKEGKKGDRKTHASKCNQDYITLLDACARETGVRAIDVVRHYLTTWDDTWNPDDFNTDMNFTFRVDGELLIDNPKIQEYWANKFWSLALEEKDEDEDSEEQVYEIKSMECHICGSPCIPVPRHPFKIKSIPHGQSKGNAIISANKNAFSSYGLVASLIAPTCKVCAENYPKAANALLKNEDTHISIGPLVYIFWTKEDTGFSFVSLLSKPEPGDVQTLIKSAFGGKDVATSIDETPFYATAFSASGARVVVRDWLETTIAAVKKNLARYFLLQKIVEWNGEEGLPIRLYELAAATVPRNKGKPDMKKLTPNIPTIIMQCALKGQPLPSWLLYQAVKRIKAERDVRKSHAALIKMVMQSYLSDEIVKEGKMERLDLTNKEPAYLCGRLLALLESIQWNALGRTNTTIVDRYYGAASSSPASVFGPLLRGAQAHLGKLRKNKEAAYIALQRKLEEIQCDLSSFPKTLNLEKQGLFALGYYHQRASDRAGAAAHKENQSQENEQ